MTPYTRFALAAPVALALTACGDTTEVDDRVVETAGIETPADVTLPDVAVEYPEVPIDARNTIEYAGTYELRNRQNEVSTIILDDDDTYVLRAPDGTEVAGTFEWGEDNSRIFIDSGGETHAYAVAQDVLYRLPGEEASSSAEKSENTTWRRSASSATDDDVDQTDFPNDVETSDEIDAADE